MTTSKPTISDVAAAAGVHFATVSRALRGHANVIPATRQRVLAAARQLGYVRDPASLALCGRRHGQAAAWRPQRIALLFNRSPENGFAGFLHYREVRRGVQQRAAELGYECEVLFVDRGAHTVRSLHRHLASAGIRGLVFGAFESDRPTVELPWSEYCAVKFDSRQALPAFTFVSVDQAHATRLAFRRMRELGYRRIGLAVDGDDELVTGGLHVAGLLVAQAEVPARERVPTFFFKREWKTAAATKAIGPWLRREGVDAVISNWTQMWRMVRPHALRQRRRIASAGLCIVRHHPLYAGVGGDMHLVGAQAVELLAGLLQAGRFGIPAAATSTYIRGRWRDGSTAPPMRLQ